MSNDGVTFRPAGPDDESFLLEVYASTREQELAMTGWNQAQQDAFIRTQFAAQQQHYRAYYPQGDHRIILMSGQAVGRLYTAEDEEEIRILDITVLPSHRNAGIGSPIIKGLLARAGETGKLVRIYIETYNRSIQLFERLGFARIEDDGVNALFEWRHRP
jgi:RimJ/RimL family protein N-acetyltransferase